MIRNKIKKITSAILIMTLALCLFGCGEKGEPKLSTIEEISAELDNMIDYEAFGLEKVKDEFSETYVVMLPQENLTEKCKSAFDNVTDINKNKVVYPALSCEKLEEKYECSVLLMLNIMTCTEENYVVDEILISDGETVYTISNDAVGISSAGSVENINMFQITGFFYNDNNKNMDNLSKLAKSDNKLKIRLNFSDDSTISVENYELTDEEDVQLKTCMKAYLELKDKCDQDKIYFPV